LQWANEDVIEARTVLRLISQWVVPHVRLEVAKRGPDDDRVLECSQSSGSDYIVTGDKDLLDLQRYAGATILKPAEFLKLLQGDRKS